MPKETYPKTEIIKRSKRIEKLYNQYADEIARYVKKKKIVYKKPFWKHNPDLKKFVSSNLKTMQDSIASEIVKGVEKSWQLANLNNDLIVTDYIKGYNVPIQLSHSFMQHNNVALNAFLNRSINGLRISGRVWLTSMKAQKMIEYSLASGITDGKSAASISRMMRQSLKNPNALYRRVKNPETGELELSKPAKKFKPGSGVYRSAYQNSLRLASTEINMAYRTSDFVRWNQVPFVVGYVVKLSNAHPKFDICDEMTGRYPKTFHFFGWHPRCICYAVPIMLSKKKFVDYVNTGRIASTEYVKRIPRQATSYMKKITPAIDRAKNKPYFVQQNFKKKKGVYQFN